MRGGGRCYKHAAPDGAWRSCARRLCRLSSCPPTLVGNCSLVIGHWSLVIGHWSLVIGHWSFAVCYSQLSTLSLLAPPLAGVMESACPSGPNDQIITCPDTTTPFSK